MTSQIETGDTFGSFAVTGPSRVMWAHDPPSVQFPVRCSKCGRKGHASVTALICRRHTCTGCGARA